MADDILFDDIGLDLAFLKRELAEAGASVDPTTGESELQQTSSSGRKKAAPKKSLKRKASSAATGPKEKKGKGKASASTSAPRDPHGDPGSQDHDHGHEQHHDGIDTNRSTPGWVNSTDDDSSEQTTKGEENSISKLKLTTERDKRAKATSKSAALRAAAAATAAAFSTGKNAPLAPRHDNGPASSNQGVYRHTLMGTALFAALQDMTEQGWFAGRDGRLLRKKTLEVFDEEAEEQAVALHAREAQARAVRAERAAAQLKAVVATGASEAESDVGGEESSSSTTSSARGTTPNQHSIASKDSNSSSKGKASSGSNAPSAPKEAKVKPAWLEGTITKYNQSAGFWTIIAENVTLNTGAGAKGGAFSSVVHMPVAKLVFKARDARSSRGVVPKAKVPRALKTEVK